MRDLIEQNGAFFTDFCRILIREFECLNVGLEHIPSQDDILILPYNLDMFFFHKTKPE